MDLLHLVDRLEELVASAQKMPIGNRAIIDRRRLLDVVDQMRIAVPQEVRDAQDIVAHRDAIRREAEEEGRILLAQAEERGARLVETHEITQSARHRAEEIAVEAEARL
ncbi:MAG: ATPase, partial [Chloroflexota bacterium]